MAVSMHPMVKQSPSLISSRAKSPVKLDPEVYLGEKKGGGAAGVVAMVMIKERAPHATRTRAAAALWNKHEWWLWRHK